jgi:hypothetical protein
MPWLSENTKDVVSCDKLWGGANIFKSIDVRMGKPIVLKIQYCEYSQIKPRELKHLST